MTDTQPLTRRERRALEREDAHGAVVTRRAARRAARERGARATRLRKFAFGGVVVAVFAIGGALAFGDFLDRPAAGSAGDGTIVIQSSMAGFTPSEIRVTAGETAVLLWWTNDAAVHLEGGVHTMVAPELDLYEELAAESKRTVVWQVPDMPGSYDVYCDSCCGGKDSPSMHATIVVEPAAAATLFGRLLA